MTTALPVSIPLRQGKCSLAAMELARRSGVFVELSKLEAMTEEMFSSDYFVDVHHDPEIADFATIVFSVVVADPLEDALARQDLWIARLIEIVPDRPGRFCLSLDVQG